MDDQQTYANASRVIETLMAARGRSRADLMSHLGLSKGRLSERLSGSTRWTVPELASLADYFQVSPAVFFQPVDRLLVTTASGAPTQEDGMRRGHSPAKPRKRTRALIGAAA